MSQTEVESNSLEDGPAPVLERSIDSQGQRLQSANEQFIFPAQAGVGYAGASQNPVWLAVQVMMQHKAVVLGVVFVIGLAFAFRTGLDAGLEAIQYVTQLSILAAALVLMLAGAFYVFITLPRTFITEWKARECSESSPPASIIVGPGEDETSDRSDAPVAEIPREGLSDFHRHSPSMEPASPSVGTVIPPPIQVPRETATTVPQETAGVPLPLPTTGAAAVLSEHRTPIPRERELEPQSSGTGPQSVSAIGDEQRPPMDEAQRRLQVHGEHEPRTTSPIVQRESEVVSEVLPAPHSGFTTVESESPTTLTGTPLHEREQEPPREQGSILQRIAGRTATPSVLGAPLKSEPTLEPQWPEAEFPGASDAPGTTLLASGPETRPQSKPEPTRPADDESPMVVKASDISMQSQSAAGRETWVMPLSNGNGKSSHGAASSTEDATEEQGYEPAPLSGGAQRLENSGAASRQNIAVPESIQSEELATQADDRVFIDPHAMDSSGEAKSLQEHALAGVEQVDKNAVGPAPLSITAAEFLKELQRAHREFKETIRAARASLALESDLELARLMEKELDDEEAEFNDYLQARWDKFSNTDETATAYGLGASGDR